MKNIILMSVSDPDEIFINMIKSVMEKGSEYISDIIVVDAGSKQRTHYIFRRLHSIGIRVISTGEKTGLCESLRLGLAWIKEHETSIDGIVAISHIPGCSAEKILEVARIMDKNRSTVVVSDKISQVNPEKLYHRLLVGYKAWRLERKTGVSCIDPANSLIGIPAEVIGLAVDIGGNDINYGFNLILNMVKNGVSVTSLRSKEAL